MQTYCAWANVAQTATQCLSKTLVDHICRFYSKLRVRLLLKWEDDPLRSQVDRAASGARRFSVMVQKLSPIVLARIAGAGMGFGVPSVKVMFLLFSGMCPIPYPLVHRQRDSQYRRTILVRTISQGFLSRIAVEFPIHH